MPHESSQQLKTYLFACVHNAGRSQMAAALFNLYADRSRCRALSAGTEPADRVHPEVVEVMREIGVDLSSERPRRLTDDLARTASVLVTMGCGEACPCVPGLRIIDWALPDPKGQSLQAVRAIRNEIHDAEKRSRKRFRSSQSELGLRKIKTKIKRRIIPCAEPGSRTDERTRTNQEVYYQPT
jgi:arsenate reductase (thioredoxin)